MIAYVHAADRKSERAEAHLGDFAGILQVDGLGGYTALAKRHQQLTVAFGWPHVRRKFFDLADKSPVATEVLQRISGLCAIESEVLGTSADHRRTVRDEHARVIPRACILLRRNGVMINRKKAHRLYKEEDLAERRRRSRKRAVGTRALAPVLALTNQRWSLDFDHDQMSFARRVRVLNVVDNMTSDSLAAVPNTSIPGHRVLREMTHLITKRGKPGKTVSDNGTELTSNAVLARRGQNSVE